MIADLEFRPEAKQEFERSARWYDHQVDGLAADFTGEVFDCLIRISQFPKGFRHAR